MRLADPFTLKFSQPKDVIIFAASQRVGRRRRQEDYFLNFNDECFVVADGIGSLTHSDVASRLACETAVWAYKLVRQRQFYWSDKKLFMNRIFRSTNITLWQKRRERGFEGGLGTTMVVAMIGDRNFWVGSAGDSSAWYFHEETLTKLTTPDADAAGALTKYVGYQRYGMLPSFTGGRLGPGDCLLLATDGVSAAVSEKNISTILAAAGTTNEHMTAAVTRLLDESEKNGATDNMTAVIIKRIATAAAPQA